MTYSTEEKYYKGVCQIGNITVIKAWRLSTVSRLWKEEFTKELLMIFYNPTIFSCRFFRQMYNAIFASW